MKCLHKMGPGEGAGGRNWEGVRGGMARECWRAGRGGEGRSQGGQMKAIRQKKKKKKKREEEEEKRYNYVRWFGLAVKR